MTVFKTLSPELKKWLKRRDDALKLKAAMRAEGGHMLLNNSATDPRTLPVPLRTEVIKYLIEKRT